MHIIDLTITHRDPDPTLQQPAPPDDDDDDDEAVEGFSGDVGGEIENVEVIELHGKPLATQTGVTVVDNDGRRHHVCTFCEKTFKKSSHLKQHIRSHTGSYQSNTVTVYIDSTAHYDTYPVISKQKFVQDTRRIWLH